MFAKKLSIYAFAVPCANITCVKRINFRRMLIICLSIYVLLCIGCASFQRRLIYFPPVLTPAQVDENARLENLERWTNSSGQPIGMKRLSPKQPADGQVMVVYGNGSCATGSARFANQIQSVAAFDVFILEYPGYADRPGKPSQKNFFKAADEAFKSLPAGKPTYLLGESLGTGVAAFLAGTYSNRVAGVVLFAPYNRLTDVGQYHAPVLPVRLILVDRYPSQDFLRTYHGPVGMLVAGADNVVPQKFGHRLYDAYDGPKHIWEFPADNHWSVTERSPDFWKEVLDFWNAHPQ